MRGALAAAVLLLHSARAHAACTKDTDCKDELVCEAGACVTPTSAPPDDANGWGLPPPAGERADAAATLAVPSAEGNASASSEANTRSDSTAPPPRPLSSDAKAKLVEKPMRPASQPLVVLGVVSVTASGVTLYGVIMAANLALLCNSVGHSDSGVSCDKHDRTAAALGVATVALIGVGIPMIMIGSKRVPAQPTGRAALVPIAVRSGAGLGIRLELQ